MLGYLRCPACICAQYNLSGDDCRGGANEGAPAVTTAPDDSNDSDIAAANTDDANDANTTADTDDANDANATADADASATADTDDANDANGTAATATTTAASHLDEDGSDVAAAAAGLGANGFVTVVAACKLGEDRLPMFKDALQSWLQLPADVVQKVVIVDWSSDFDLAATTSHVIKTVCPDASSPITCGGVSIDVHKVGPPDIEWRQPVADNFAVFHGGALHSSTFHLKFST